ncbi:MAG TPA: aminoacyl-tRNA hydrolase [Holophaga sp.]|nr:aminoacyl-tRNA hydrolase [Holophaga sp.]
MWTCLGNLIGRRAPEPLSTGSRWILVPLGNPGGEYVDTRHNLGRLMIQRWMSSRRCQPERVRALETGALYDMGPSLLALVPSTYMNHSGKACAEAVAAGLDPARMILLHDDKDLPLGLGRFRLKGGTAGHNGLASIFECLGTQDLARLRLGIGPLRRPLHEFVLGTWTEEEWGRIDALDAPFSRFMELLGEAKSLGGIPGTVNAASFWGEAAPPGNP